MSFIKHIGKHGDRKVAIIFRMVPGEDHMCLVTYPDTLPKQFHNAIMKVIESTPGQQAENLSDALHRNLLPDGRQILETLHREGMIKKVATQHIIVTPNATSHVHLNELNKMLGDINTGNEASDKMKKLDENSGLVDRNTMRESQAQTPVREEYKGPDIDMSDFSDTGLARQRQAQADRMIFEADQLLTESKRLQEEAWHLDPSLKPKKTVKKKAVRKKTVKKSTPKKKVTADPVSTSDPVA